MFATPILLLVFNRPDTTQQVFERIRQLKPKYLFVAADGPRENKEGEKESTEKVRKIITENIDWDCELKTLFRDENLGCGKGPADAITWFFEQVEQGVILEDDCLANLSFFTYCQELLAYYQDNPQVMVISGNNFQPKKKWGNGSYFFSNYPTLWGWATWRRAWQHFDFYLQNSQKFIEHNQITQITQTVKEQNYWKSIFDLVKDGKREDIWDYQWLFTIWDQGGLTIVPNKNLVTNIGFSDHATHTVGSYFEKIYTKKSHRLDTIVHPETIKIYPKAELNTFQNYFSVEQKTMDKLKSIIRKQLKKIIK